MVAEGPPSYANWRSLEAGEELRRAYEVPCFSDATLTGVHEHTASRDVVLGPYHLFDTLGPSSESSGVSEPILILRVDVHMQSRDSVDNDANESRQRYHGGDLDDELAALLSLACGMRLKAGYHTRDFGAESDSRGRPIEFRIKSNPVLIPANKLGLIVPKAIGPHDLNRSDILRQLPLLTPVDASAVIRVARIYQDALWIAESDPSLTWLLLVSALEAAADHWNAQINAPPIDTLKNAPSGSYARRLYELLISQEGGEELAANAAEILAPMMGSTRKFLAFIETFLPPPPNHRPSSSAAQLDWAWTNKGMRGAMSKVYNYRSKALHGGQRFPEPMSWSPTGMGSVDKTTGEIRVSDEPIEILQHGAAAHGATWTAEELPVLLHTFEYIVRGALLSWWSSMVPGPNSSLSELDVDNA